MRCRDDTEDAFEGRQWERRGVVMMEPAWTSLEGEFYLDACALSSREGRQMVRREIQSPRCW